MRESDLVARLGGDEFAIVMAPAQTTQDAERMADRVVRAMREPVPLPGGARLQASVSVGVALFPQHAQDMAGLLRAADDAMYEVKAEGRGHHRMAA